MTRPHIDQITGVASCCTCYVVTIQGEKVVLVATKSDTIYSLLAINAIEKIKRMQIQILLLLQPRCCNDLVRTRHICKAAILRTEVYAVRTSRAGEGEMLQKRHHEEEKLHASKRLSNTRSFS